MKAYRVGPHVGQLALQGKPGNLDEGRILKIGTTIQPKLEEEPSIVLKAFDKLAFCR